MKYLSNIIVYLLLSSVMLWGIYKLLNIPDISPIIFWTMPTFLSVILLFILIIFKMNQFTAYLFFVLGNSLSFDFLFVPLYIFCNEKLNIPLIFRIIIFLINILLIFLFYYHFIRKKKIQTSWAISLYILVIFLQLNSYFYEWSL